MTSSSKPISSDSKSTQPTQPTQPTHRNDKTTRAITPVITKQRQRIKTDPLFNLPPDLSVNIIDQLSDSDLRVLPAVHPRWASMFYNSQKSPVINSIFRSLLRRRYHLPCNFNVSSWGTLYLSLRRERCHLCPNDYIFPFAYAASPTLSLALLLFPNLILFPVCRSCFFHLIHCCQNNQQCRGGFIPVLEFHALPLVFHHSIADEQELVQIQKDSHVCNGFLYSDLSAPVSYVLARPISATLSTASLKQPQNQPEHQT